MTDDRSRSAGRKRPRQGRVETGCACAAASLVKQFDLDQAIEPAIELTVKSMCHFCGNGFGGGAVKLATRWSRLPG